MQLSYMAQMQAWKDVALHAGFPAEREAHWNEFTSRENEVEQAAQALETEVTDSSVKSQIESLRESHNALGATCRQALRRHLMACPFDHRAAGMMVDGKASALSGTIARLTDSLKVEPEPPPAKPIQASFPLWPAALLAAIVLLGILLGTSAARSMRKFVAQAKAWQAGNVAAIAVPAKGKGEFREIAEAFHAQAETQRVFVREVKDHGRELAAAGRQAALAVKQSAGPSDSHGAFVAQTAAAAREMTSSLAEMTSTATQVTEAATQAAERARRGDQVMGQVLGGMRDIANSVGTTAESIAALGKRSDEIGRIVGVIDDIADQTNLLALNAAIEAARAGEQGRGFAVVADEVRKLAERTTNATKEITAMIAAVQEETQRAVSTMQSGRQQVDRGVEITSEAGMALTEIIEMTDRVSSLAGQIAGAAARQETANATVNQGVEQLSGMLSGSSSEVHKISTACDRIKTLAEDLQDTLDRAHPGSDTAEAEEEADAQLPAGNYAHAPA